MNPNKNDSTTRREFVKEVAAGYECGMGIKDFNESEVGDRLEFFRREKAS